MKKFLALVCMITCVFGLTACGSEEVLTQHEQDKLEAAKQYASEVVIDTLVQLSADESREMLEAYTVEEVSYLMNNVLGFGIKDGFAFRSAIDSFDSALDEIGDIVSIGEATAKIDDDTIVVNVDVVGELRNAKAEVIFANDAFAMTVQSASLNPVATFGDMMVTAALNTLIGMGTVFVVLILISGIISCFAFIPKIQAAFSKKEKKVEAKTDSIDNAVAQIVTQETVDESDDLELVAVIAAAIAAYEGATSTDGFVVRSIRKVNRGRR